MAKKNLSLVPAVPGSLTTAATSRLASPAEIPKGLKKLTLPPLVKPEQVAIGSMIDGVIVALVASISDKVKEGKLLHLKHASGTEFLFPLTGTIKKSLGGFEGVTEKIGKHLFLVRLEDGETDKYGAKGDAPKKVYMFDVYLKD